MTSAVGIHDHPTKKLGLIPNDPTRPRVKIGSFLNTAVTTPIYPDTDTAPVLTWPMDHNADAGCCVVAGTDHAFQAIDAQLLGQYVGMSDDVMLLMYQSQNPGFKSWADAGGPNDNGMVIQLALEWLVANGYILAFGEIDLTNMPEVLAATYIGLAIITGETLDVAQQDQQVWDTVKGSAEWGGHCTTWVGYDPNLRQVTWGELLAMSTAFIKNQVSEAWFILRQSHVDHPSFRDNFDLAGFAAAVSEMTGGKVVVPVTPKPTPTPPAPPTPAPVPSPPVDADATVAAVMREFNAKSHIGINEVMKKANEVWLAAKGL